MRALSIRQPFAEMILRGEKTIEYRSRATRIIGERFYIYASRGKASRHRGIVEARAAALTPALTHPLTEREKELPRGVIVGTAVIAACEGPMADGAYHWHLKDVQRLETPIAPTGHPQPVWFRPF